jgi:hypothetical protein
MKDKILMGELRDYAKPVIYRDLGSAREKYLQSDFRQVFSFGQKSKDHSDIILAVLSLALI